MKKVLLFCLLAVTAASISFAQIYTGEGEGRNGTVSISLHYVDYANYNYLFRINGVSVFLDEDNITSLKDALEKFFEWEALAVSEQVTITRTISSITFTTYHHDHVFFSQPLTFFLVFTGGPLRQTGTRGAFLRQASNEDDIEDEGEAPPMIYSLFIDTSLERISPLRISSNDIEELLYALSPENLAEAWHAHERQRALEDLFF